jgi:hypothetical protein
MRWQQGTVTGIVVNAWKRPQQAPLGRRQEGIGVEQGIENLGVGLRQHGQEAVAVLGHAYADLGHEGAVDEEADGATVVGVGGEVEVHGMSFLGGKER